MNNINKKKVLFVDRDGTLCKDDGAFEKDINYADVLKNMEPYDGLGDLLKKIKQKNFLIVVISNQAGIAKGLFDEWQTHVANKKIQQKLDGVIDGFYYCPHHTTGTNKKGVVYKTIRKNLICNCDCRKPKTGMFVKFQNDLMSGKIQYIDENIINEKLVYKIDRDDIFKNNITPSIIDKENSYMVGDKFLDVESGENFGVKPILVLTGEGEIEYKKHKNEIDKLKNIEIYKTLNDFLYSIL